MDSRSSKLASLSIWAARSSRSSAIARRASLRKVTGDAMVAVPDSCNGGGDATGTGPAIYRSAARNGSPEASGRATAGGPEWIAGMARFRAAVSRRARRAHKDAPGRPERVGRQPFLDDLAAIHDDHARAQPCDDAEIVADADHRHAGRCANSARRSRMPSWVVTSSPVVGSSSNSNSGSPASAMAMATRCN